jgi:hypothetical protein
MALPRNQEEVRCVATRLDKRVPAEYNAMARCAEPRSNPCCLLWQRVGAGLSEMCGHGR